MASYPTSVKSFTTRLSGQTIAPAHTNDLQDEVNAIETQLLAGVTSYTPTWTAASVNPTIGDGTIVGAYHQVGTLVYFRIALTIGSTTTTGTGAWSFTLPFTAVGAIGFPHGEAVIYDAGTGQLVAVATQETTTKIFVIAHNTSTAAGPTVPITWAAGDVLAISGVYVKA